MLQSYKIKLIVYLVLETHQSCVLFNFMSISFKVDKLTLVFITLFSLTSLRCPTIDHLLSFTNMMAIKYVSVVTN